MPRVRLTRRIGPIGVALTLVDVWRRLPPKQRRLLARQVRRHGPALAKKALAAQRRRKR
ncbi:MAG TPA: hypothetical protein VFB25_03975 [Gaiellaceae bacterium]|nr:hypothetical protein [Gaiellaceae bacterium]